MSRTRQVLRYATGFDLAIRLLRLYPDRTIPPAERATAGTWRQLSRQERHRIARRCAWRFHGYAVAALVCVLFTVSALLTGAWGGAFICFVGVALCASQMMKHSIVAYQFRRGEPATPGEWWQQAAIPKIDERHPANE